MSDALINTSLRNLLHKHGLRIGSRLENSVTWKLHRHGVLDECQYRVGKYRLDYAWPAERIALEADGVYHWTPEVALKDVARDHFLRGNGWLVFRVDNENGNLEDQIDRFISILIALRHNCFDALRDECAPACAPKYPTAGQLAAERRRLAAIEAGNEEGRRLNLWADL